MLAFFRERMKDIVWIIVWFIVFVMAISLLGPGAMIIFGDDPAAARRANAGRLDDPASSPAAADPLLSSTKVVAEITVGDRKELVTEGELEKALRQTQLAQGGAMPDAARNFYRPMVLDRIVNEKLILLEADQKSLDVSAEVDKQLEGLWSRIGKDEYLARTGQSEAELKSALVRQNKLEAVLSEVTGGKVVPEAELKAYYEAHKDEFKAAGAAEPIPFGEAKPKIVEKLRADVRDADIEAYYQLHKARWKKPRKARLLHLAVDPRSEARTKAVTATEAEVAAWYEAHKGDYLERERAELAHIFVDPAHPEVQAGVTVPEAKIKQYYDLNREEYEEEEKVRVSQILLKGDDAEAKAKAALERIKKGESFEKVAGEVSQDDSSKRAGGDLGWVSQLELPENLAELAFVLPEGRITDPIRTPQGLHVLKIVGKRVGELKPLSEVREEIEKDLRQEAAFEAAETAAKAILAELTKPGADFAAVAAARSHAASRLDGGKLGVVVLGENPKSALLDEVGTEGFLDFGIQKAASETKIGAVAGPVRSFKGYHLVKVLGRPERATRPLAEVRETVAAAARADKIRKAVDGVLEEARKVAGPEAADPAARAKLFKELIARESDSKDKEKLGGDWGLVALSTEVPPELPEEVKGEVVSWNGLSRRIVEAVEDLAAGQVSGPVELSGMKHLFLVAEVAPDEHATLDEVRDEVKKALDPRVPDEAIAKYFEEHKDEFKVETEDREIYHVLVSTQEDAVRLLEEIKAGKQDFDAVARGADNRDRVTARDGGRIKGKIQVKAIREAVERAAPDSLVAEPVKSHVGWHIVKVGKVTPPKEPTLDEVKEQIRAKLADERRREIERSFLTELRNKARIETFLAPGSGMEGLQALMQGLGKG